MKIILTLFKQNKYFNLLNILIATVFSCLLMVLVINMDYTVIESNTVENFKDKNLYQISDELYDEKETSFFSVPSNYDKLYNFSKELEEKLKYIYYNPVWQPIGVADFKGDIKYDAYYESGNNQPPFNIGDTSYRTVKSMRFNKTVFDLNNLQLKTGKMFKEEDYVLHDNIIPIILGSDLSNIYKLGDTINILFYQKEFKAEVIGFLNANQKVLATNEPEVLLDRYIVLPAINFSEAPSAIKSFNSQNELFFKAILLSNSNGKIVTDSSPLEIKKTINEISTKTGFSDFTIIGANTISTDILVKMTEQHTGVLISVLVVLFLIILIISVFVMYLKVKRSISTYLALLISGASLKDIYKIVIGEFIFANVIGCFIPVLFLLFITKGSILLLTNYLFLVIVFLLVSTLLINIMVKKTFHTIDIVQSLKG